MSRFEARQEEMGAEIKDLGRATAKNRHELGRLDNNLNSRMDVIEKDQERQEIERVKGNLKFFNVNESEESVENCKQTVIDLLSSHYPDEDWDKNQFDAVFRLGRKESSRGARPILVKCRDVATARKILGLRKGRESLASVGIKIAQERTRRQDQQLRLLREQGKNPYLFRGQIRYREGGVREKSVAGAYGNSRTEPKYTNEFPSLVNSRNTLSHKDSQSILKSNYESDKNKRSQLPNARPGLSKDRPLNTGESPWKKSGHGGARPKYTNDHANSSYTGQTVNDIMTSPRSLEDWERGIGRAKIVRLISTTPNRQFSPGRGRGGAQNSMGARNNTTRRPGQSYVQSRDNELTGEVTPERELAESKKSKVGESAKSKKEFLDKAKMAKQKRSQLDKITELTEPEAKENEKETEKEKNKEKANTLADNTPSYQNGNVHEMSVGEPPSGHSRDNNQSAVQAMGSVLCSDRNRCVSKEMPGAIDFHAALHAFSQDAHQNNEQYVNWCEAVEAKNDNDACSVSSHLGQNSQFESESEEEEGASAPPSISPITRSG